MLSNEKYQVLEEQEQETGRAALLTNEDGSVIILALIMLMLLTMVGTSATNTSSIEIQVAGNERNYKQIFFRTEAAAMQTSQRIQDAPTHTESWIHEDDENVTYLDPANHDWSHSATTAVKDWYFNDISKWVDLSASPGAQYQNTYSLVLYTGVAPWSSLDMTSQTQVRAFSIYGQLQDNARNERMIIETGFARRM